MISKILILEVKEDFGSGGNPHMQLVGYYAKLMAEQYRKLPALQQTCLPVLGIVAWGNMIKQVS